MTFTERELATIRAALHCWLIELRCFMAEELQATYPDLRDAEPLGPDEVEELLIRLSTDGLPGEGSDRGVSSVGPVSADDPGDGT